VDDSGFQRPTYHEPVFFAPEPEPDRGGDGRRHLITPVKAVALLVVLGIVAVFGLDACARGSTEAKAAAVAAELSGRDGIRVSCPGPIARVLVYETNAGWVAYTADGPSDEAKLTAEICDGLARLIDQGPALDLACLETDSCSPEDRRVALGVAVLAHEAAHLSSISDEAEAECFSYANSEWTALRLGASPRAAARIPVWQREFQAPRMPSRYQGAC
jgi:hypothetical protein